MRSWQDVGWTARWIFGIGLGLLAGAAYADTVTFDFVSENESAKFVRLNPPRYPLLETPPDTIKSEPVDLSAPLYRVLMLGPKEQPTPITVLVDAPNGDTPRLFVDANANGNLNDDPPLAWKRRDSKPGRTSGLTTYACSVSVSVRYGDKVRPLQLALVLFHYDKDESNPALRDTLVCTADYAAEGQITLNGKTYKAMLADARAGGDMRGESGVPASGVMLLIDVNGNGKFESRGEAFDIAQPFNIKGTTWEVQNMDPSGTTFEIVKSNRSVAEIPPPPDLRPGHKVPPFEKKTLDGQTVRFPDDYKGKLVVLYFWASWCGDCAAERPFLVQAYDHYHPKGIQFLGISVDEADFAAPLATFLKANRMPWPEVYDGKKWHADIAQLYYINEIPSAFLIDGDTGEVLAAGDDLLSKKLEATLEKFAAEKKQATHAHTQTHAT